MNIIINGFHDELISPVVPRLLKKLEVTYCEHISSGSFAFKPGIEEYIHHDFRDLNLGHYPVDLQLLTPLDEPLILSLRNEEAMVMKMFDRLEQYIGRLSYQKRKMLYLTHLRYWNDILEKKHVDLFISSNIPHEIYDFIIYSLCRKKNIPTLMLYQSIPDFVFLLENMEEFIPRTRERFNENIKPESKNEITLSPRAEHLWKSQTSSVEDPVPVYMKKKTHRERWIELSKRAKQYFYKITHASLYKNIFKSESRKIFLFRLLGKHFISFLFFRQKQFYNRHCIVPDENQKFIYLPLHYQPELTTSPLAGVFVDQILMVEMISSHLPVGMKIYIKENPKQKVWGRESDFYQKLLQIEGVCFVGRKHNSFDLINKSVAVATATGTAGWEALFRGKPVLMFGNMFYQKAPGVFKIRQNSDCKRAFNHIRNGTVKPKENIMKSFIKVMDEVTLFANQQLTYQKASSLDKDENLDNLTNGLLDKIKQKGIV